MEYKWTPFQILSLLLLCYAVYDFIAVNDNTGLGALFPYLLIGFSVGFFIMDIVLQQLMKNRMRLFYICEAVAITAFAIWTISIGGF